LAHEDWTFISLSHPAESLGADVSSMDLQESDKERHLRSAEEILQRIQNLEKKVFVNVYFFHQVFTAFVHTGYL